MWGCHTLPLNSILRLLATFPVEKRPPPPPLSYVNGMLVGTWIKHQMDRMCVDSISHRRPSRPHIDDVYSSWSYSWTAYSTLLLRYDTIYIYRMWRTCPGETSETKNPLPVLYFQMCPHISHQRPGHRHTTTDCAWTSHLKVKIRVFVSISNRLKFFIHFQHINIEESDRTAATAVVTITPTPEHNEIRVDFHLTTTLSCQPAEAVAVAVADGQQ